MENVREVPGELTSRGWALLAATTYGVAALVVGTAVATWFFREPIPGLLSTSGMFYAPTLILGATVGGAVLGGLTWWWIVGSSDDHLLLRGAAGGLLTGVLSHVVMWMLHGFLVSLLPTYSLYLVWSGALFFFLPLSLLLFGWLTGLAGAVVGVGLAAVRRSIDDPEPETKPPHTE